MRTYVSVGDKEILNFVLFLSIPNTPKTMQTLKISLYLHLITFHRLIWNFHGFSDQFPIYGQEKNNCRLNFEDDFPEICFDFV